MAETTVGKYLVQRLEETGLSHVFGLPGDYVLGFFDLLVESDLDLVGTATEIGAGYAADAYARVHGLGALCVTYCVGGLNALNAVAGAYAEKSPLIVISGAPGLGERAHQPLLHHQVRGFRTQLEIFEKVTIAASAIEDRTEAPRLIDQTLAAAIRHKRPVYIEMPRDMVDQPCPRPIPRKLATERSDPDALAEAMEETTSMLRRAKRPVILAGVEIHRFGLQPLLEKLVEHAGCPVAATLLGKSVIGEGHPQYLGVYEGAMGQDNVRRVVEGADCLLVVGAFMTDINLGVYTAKLDIDRTINATSERLSIRHHHFDDVTLRDFMNGLLRSDLGGGRNNPLPPKEPAPFRPRPNQPIRVRRFFQRMNAYLDADSVVICDIGDSLFGAADLTIQRRTDFLSPAYYTSMGFGVPAAVGAQMGQRRGRPIVFVGDGAFQMTGQELSTIAKLGLNPIIIVLNNHGYTTERVIHPGPYNDIHDWAYHRWPEILRAGWGCEAHTEGELEEALERAKAADEQFTILNVHLDPMDYSPALSRLGKRLSSQMNKKPRRSAGSGKRAAASE